MVASTTHVVVVVGGGGGDFGWILTMWSRNGSWYYSRGGGTLRAGSGGQADGEFGPGVHSVHVLAEWCGRHKLRHRHVGHHPHHELNMWTVQIKVLWPLCWPPPAPWIEHEDITSQSIVTVMLAATHTMNWTWRLYKSKYCDSHVDHHPHHELNMETLQVQALWPSCWPEGRGEGRGGKYKGREDGCVNKVSISRQEHLY